MVVADNDLGHMIDTSCHVRDDRIERVGVGDGRQTVGLLNTRSAEYIRSQRLALHRASAEICGQIIQGGGYLVDNGHLMPLLEQAVRQLRAYTPTADDDN